MASSISLSQNQTIYSPVELASINTARCLPEMSLSWHYPWGQGQEKGHPLCMETLQAAGVWAYFAPCLPSHQLGGRATHRIGPNYALLGRIQAREARPSTHRHTTYSLGMPPPAINANRPSCPQPVQAAWQTVRGIHKQAWMEERWLKRLRPAETYLLPRRRKQAKGRGGKDFKIGAPLPTQVDLTFCHHIFIDGLLCSSTYFFPIS